MKIQVVSLPEDGVEVLARLTSLVHLTLHVSKNVPEESAVIRAASFPNLKDFMFRCEGICLVFEAGAMHKLQSLTVECNAEAERVHGYADLFGSIGHLERSLMSFKLDSYNKEDFTPSEYLIFHAYSPPQLETSGPDKLEAALREKYPGIPDIRIRCL